MSALAISFEDSSFGTAALSTAHHLRSRTGAQSQHRAYPATTKTCAARTLAHMHAACDSTAEQDTQARALEHTLRSLARIELDDKQGMAHFDAIGAALATDEELVHLMEMCSGSGVRGLCAGILMQRQLQACAF